MHLMKPGQITCKEDAPGINASWDAACRFRRLGLNGQRLCAKVGRGEARALSHTALTLSPCIALCDFMVIAGDHHSEDACACEIMRGRRPWKQRVGVHSGLGLCWRPTYNIMPAFTLSHTPRFQYIPMLFKEDLAMPASQTASDLYLLT